VEGGDCVVLRDALLQRAESHARRIAYTYRDDSLTFAELAERAVSRACSLQRGGVGPGSRVAVAMSAGLPLVETFWALQLLGAVPCLFNPSVPEPTLRGRIEMIRPVVVVTDATTVDRGAAGTSLTHLALDPDGLAYLQFTSGTSGKPRAAMLRHTNVIAYLHAAEADGHVGADDRLVSWVPPWHDLGLVRFVIGAVYYGVTCHITEPAIRTIPDWLATISRARGTVSGAPDFAYRVAVRMVDPTTVDLSSLRISTIAAEPVRWATIQEFETRFGVPGALRPAYGLAEATLGVTATLVGDEVNVDERGNVSNGQAHSCFEVHAGASLEAPEEILVRGAPIFAGYFDAPEETKRTLQGGWLHTGDFGYTDGHGRLYVLGRRSGMIKRAGAVVAPRELEEAAERVDGVRIAAATTAPAGGDGKDPVVVVVEADVSEELSRDQIARDVSSQIVAALGFAPERVIVAPRRTIPRTENGKVRHDRLRQTLFG